jgi:hypothetical protein
MMSQNEKKERYETMLEALTHEMGGEYMDRLTNMRNGAHREPRRAGIEAGGDYVALEYVNDQGATWNELDHKTQAALNVAGLEYAQLMQDHLDISDVSIGSFGLSLESGHWWLTAARCWLYELTGELEWLPVLGSVGAY